MNVPAAKHIIAELAPMLDAGTIEEFEHHIRLLSEAAVMVSAALEESEGAVVSIQDAMKRMRESDGSDELLALRSLAKRQRHEIEDLEGRLEVVGVKA